MVSAQKAVDLKFYHGGKTSTELSLLGIDNTLHPHKIIPDLDRFQEKKAGLGDSSYFFAMDVKTQMTQNCHISVTSIMIWGCKRQCTYGNIVPAHRYEELQVDRKGYRL